MTEVPVSQSSQSRDGAQARNTNQKMGPVSGTDDQDCLCPSVHAQKLTEEACPRTGWRHLMSSLSGVTWGRPLHEEAGRPLHQEAGRPGVQEEAQEPIKMWI